MLIIFIFSINIPGGPCFPFRPWTPNSPLGPWIPISPLEPVSPRGPLLPRLPLHLHLGSVNTNIESVSKY